MSEHLEKPYYWDEDRDSIAPKQSFIGYVEHIGSYKKRRTREDRLNRFIPKVSEPKVQRPKSTLSTGWSGIDNYFRQCAESEKRN